MTSEDKKYAWTATVGEKGQIVIPKQARDIFGIKSGDTLLILGDEQKGLAIPPKGAFAELFDMIYDEGGDDK
ncbi:AbrB/MazE/SpoVT family DNA-binding domain-containing protein [Streptococcus gallolyticus]|jgi:AbrB family looped-hinge helix DNA binding protein|uniref:AbrB/MazE/SpoVT family DNA-binding domain-containing protein n=1 Tax=Streptococcus gallolyticus TaxID=315405 RepID=UPI0022841810|nr:AbrB/MazE/SpoVT family DNA-binding domain-containing protein [Streptococcus gallolyticus]MCF0239005.1 AbrB/MazE/SpoVT family DNA-binding domain-containing protein [Streptococcus gallolyticus]MCY7165738.1 AbrB/MazE/SpoVT family DNA-binding domain-containing protein [Streptococcus gallolyticus subsp. gallolyticus]MCY7182834.1 AbrB/MazE/SpoVT family DNA-binding domain-containing protein [Streptococcus gallolyticus subsp. gallolyticus]